MKKLILKCASTLMVVALMMFILSSCGAPIIGHTGGFTGEPLTYEYRWLETYDECVEAIDRMKVHGSTFYETMLVSYEGDLFDMKYCIKVKDSDIKEVMHPYEIFSFKFGARNFDWRAENVEIMCFAFFEDVTIDEILSSTNRKNQSKVWNFKAYKIIPNADYAKNNNFSYEGITINSLEFLEEREYYTVYNYTLDNTSVLKIKFNSNRNEALGDSELQAILGSIDADMYRSMENNFVYEKPYSPN